MEFEALIINGIGWRTALVGVVLVYPLMRIFERAGLGKMSALLIFIPALGSLITLALLAFRNWPTLITRTEQEQIRYGARIDPLSGEETSQVDPATGARS